ncbi:MAG: hypothetical protein A2499_04710 [Stygiobacter sp. RIFOXYC12_FULL_38_8]|nr:MAG: hypothetical protein A2299_03390 [Stygiobacter sp. RIFOXYB2_FULL_37_11]OGV14721.1 MAG: hypothetical protein A2440_09465 [Stygiobacter sp. RIFOXYC2_FULL_38_25]OGV22258.1 MAG: hypothetical protein A2499_04710 [Stygiobacter sp. RIFOXYC12_FULL_38_8]OGV79214.1 MAG: hypothetical protein A2X65_01835 [Stygiobacter sp. GWF2_38_21]RJQ57860.1 MAG: T9SS C-terminal target domain-containing protein [Stygiobacter sp.]
MKSIEITMKKVYKWLLILTIIFFTNLSAQVASVTWPLTSNQNPNTPIGSITASPEIISAGSSFLSTGAAANLMTIYGYNSFNNSGQELWVGNQGGTWVADPPAPATPLLDPLRFIQFNTAPTAGNNFTVTNISFKYGDDNNGFSNFNILAFKASYSINGFQTETFLNTNPLVYLNLTMSTFTAQNLNVIVPSGQTFSLRIYMYPVLRGIAMARTFAIHKDVIIEGRTSPADLNNGSLCGMKFWDYYQNGIKDESELLLGLSGWTITLTMGAVQMTAITGTNGAYCFNNLPAGTYTLTETPQDGWLQTFPPSPGVHTITLAVGQSVENIDFGNKRLLGSISGTKFNDVNGTGDQQYSNEPGLPNWTINLTGPVTTSTTTDANGLYHFDNLPAGTYTVTETNQTGWQQIYPFSPGSYTVVLSAGEIVISKNFANQIIPPSSGTICGIKYNDLNGNGIRDKEEPGLGDWQINIAGPVDRVVYTDRDGNFCFTNLPPGNYKIGEENQTGWTQTQPGSPSAYTVTLSAGQNIKDILFGNKVVAQTGCIDPPPGMVGWWTGDNNAIDISGLNNHGTLQGGANYAAGKVDQAFNIANTADYITVQDNPSLNFGIDNFSIDAWIKTTNSSGALFIVYKAVLTNLPNLSSLGYILSVRQGGYLSLHMGNGAVFSNFYNNTVQIADGKWHFVAATVDRKNVAGGKLYVDGNLILTFDPTIVANSITNTSSLLISKLDFGSVTPYENQVDEVELFNRALTSAEIASIYNAGSYGKCKPEVLLGSICGLKFNDLNGDGRKTDDEPGLPNWTINLSGAANMTATTNDKGEYCFDNLKPGTYTLTEVNQTGWLQTMPYPSSYTVILSSGERVVGKYFGNKLDTSVKLGSICGMKFNDLNGDGRKTNDEPGLPNWTIILSGAANMTAVTNDKGEYCFYKLKPGTYTITEVNQTGWLQTAPYPNTFTIVLQPGESVVGQDFGNKLDTTVRLGSICGMKFNDLNGDGKKGSDEPGLPNWTINLTGTANMTAVTDDRGEYCFYNLRPGKYTISEVFQNGWIQTAPSTGMYSFELASGEHLVNMNFGNKIDTSVKLGSICGMKFNDFNGDGKKGDDEPGLPNWVIILSGLADDKVITDEKGNFCFERLKPGKYTLSEEFQNGWKQTTPSTETYSFELASGESLGNMNFGNKIDPEVKLGSICGMKFNDLNGDGKKGNDEPGLPNWTINLSGTMTQTVTTDERGNYCFERLKPGKYTISETNKTGWTQTAPSTGTYSFELLSGQSLINQDFGNKLDVIERLGSICGIKFNDVNGNGIMDKDERGIPNWVINLSDAATMSTITDANGNYCFNKLKPGKYTIGEGNQASWLQTAPTTGTFSFELAAGQTMNNMNFGNKPDPCLTGTKIWTRLGTGMNDIVDALAVMGSNLYAGGKFTTAGGVSANYIAKWNGVGWSALGTGMNGRVNALIVDGTNLYACGDFTIAGGVTANHIAMWNGSNWSAVGTGTNGIVFALAVSGSNLFAGGTFTTAGNVSANNIAVWNGSTWSALGTGTNGGVYSLLTKGTELFVGGVFISAGGNVVNHIAKWNGSAWSSLGSGTSNNFVWAIEEVGTDYYVGGQFVTAGGITAEKIAKWNSTTSSWSALGFANTVWALEAIGTDLYVGGAFANLFYGTTIPAKYIGKWNGTTWSTLGSGMNADVYALQSMGGDLYVGGMFTTAGGLAANYIAKYACSPRPTSISEETINRTIPDRYQLEQNYPNPFNPTSTIRYNIASAGFVKISVYDILGREIRVLVNEEKGPGHYEVQFDAGNLSSGVYFYTIRTRDYSQSKKMILLK